VLVIRYEGRVVVGNARDASATSASSARDGDAVALITDGRFSVHYGLVVDMSHRKLRWWYDCSCGERDSITIDANTRLLHSISPRQSCNAVVRPGAARATVHT